MSMNMYQQPAQQTALGTQGFSLEPGEWYPDRGLILRSSLPKLPSTAAAVLNNMRWDGISWTTQNIGWTQQRATKFNSGAQFLEMAVHFLASGGVQFIQQVGNQVQLYDPTTTTAEQVLFTAGSATSIPCMRSFSPNFFLYCNGIDSPQVWNGTAWGVLGGFPVSPSGNPTLSAPNLVESFNNRAVWAGFPDDPFAILISDFGNPASYTINNPTIQPTYGGVYHVPSQLGPVTSLKVARMSQQSNQQVLLIGCQYGFAFISGLDATSFTLVTASSANRWGIPSNRCWFQLDDNLFALCTDGIRPFNTNTTFSNLISSCLSFPVHPLITGMNTAMGSQFFCLDNPNQLEVTFYYCSGSDTQNRTALILNYSDIANGLVRFSQKSFPPVVSGQPPTSPACGCAFKGLYWAGGFDGILQQLYNGSYFNTTPVTYQIQSPLFKPPTIAEEASARGFWVETEGPSTAFTLSTTVYVPQSAGNQSLVQVNTFSQDITINNNGGTILGSWILGVSAFGGTQYQITPYYPPGGGRSWQLNITGSTANGDFCFIGVFAVLIPGGTRQ